MKKNSILLPEYEEPKDIKTSETLYMLAEGWQKNVHRDYLINFRNLLIKSLKRIKTGTIEGDALALSHINGKIAAVEDILFAEKEAYNNIMKLKNSNLSQSNAKTKGEEI